MSSNSTNKQTLVKTATSANYDYDKQLAKLTDDEKQQYRDLTKSITPHDLTTLHEYGAELNSVVAENGERLLSSVRADSGGEIVALTTDLLKQLNMIDVEEINSDNKLKNFMRKLPILKKLVTSVDNIKVKYNDIAENVNSIADKIGDAKLVAMRDNSTLQEIFDNNVQYISRIRELILGAKVLEEDTAKQIAEMEANPEQYETYEISEMMDFQNSLSKRISDMQVTQSVLEQNLLQIRATQGNNIAIAEKSDNIVANVIPLWKNQLSLAVITNNQTNNVKAQQMLTDTTNKILAENAKKLHQNSVAVAKSNEESVISIETLKTTTDELVNTIKEVAKIHEEGEHNRKLIESELQQIAIKLDGAIKIMK